MNKKPELDLELLLKDAPNLQLWLSYTEVLPVPMAWKVLAWPFIISAATQRRVFFGKLSYSPLFTNMYALLVGVPATGKSLVMGRAIHLLNHHKKKVIDQTQTKGKIPTLLNAGPDSTTYESLVHKMNLGITHRKYMVDSTEFRYSSSPMWIALSECDTMFHKSQERIGPLLRKSYDGEDYSNETKNCGDDYVHQPIIAFFAGTTPAKLQDLLKMKAFADGMMSRCLYCYEPGPPKTNEFFLPDPTKEQLAGEGTLLAQILKVTELFGKCQYRKESKEWLDKLWENEVFPKLQAANEIMQNHYSRYRVNVMKLAACFQLGETTSLVIEDLAFRKAVHLMAYFEQRMVESLGRSGRNVLSEFIPKIELMIGSRKKVEMREIITTFISDLSLAEIEEILETLEAQGRIFRLEENKVKTIIWKG